MRKNHILSGLWDAIITYTLYTLVFITGMWLAECYWPDCPIWFKLILGTTLLTISIITAFKGASEDYRQTIITQLMLPFITVSYIIKIIGTVIGFILTLPILIITMGSMKIMKITQAKKGQKP